MLVATRRGFRTPRFEITEDGRPLTVLSPAARGGYEFAVGGRPHRIDRAGRRRFVLNGPTGALATADRDGGRRWVIATPAPGLELVRPKWWRSGWELRRGGRPAGVLERGGLPNRASFANLPQDLPVELRVFLYYVALMVWERANAGAVAALGG